MSRTAQDIFDEKIADKWDLDRIERFAWAQDNDDLKQLVAEQKANNKPEETGVAKKKAAKKKTVSKAEEPPAMLDVPGQGVVPVNRIRVDRIEPSPLNRTVEDNEKLQSLALSMKEAGLLQPIVVRPLDAPEDPDTARYEIVCGERRWRAARKLGWETIEAIVRVMDADGAHADRITENLQREDVPPLEQSAGATPRLQMIGLLHDAHEAYVGDLVLPLREALMIERDDEIVCVDEIGAAIQIEIFRAYIPGMDEGIETGVESRAWYRADKVSLLTELRDLFDQEPEDGWHRELGQKPDPHRLVLVINSEFAEHLFMQKYHSLFERIREDLMNDA